MTYLKVTAVAINQTPMDWQGNRMRIQEAFDEAVGNHSSIVCFPELCITGYGCEDHFHSEDLQQRALSMLDAICVLTTTEDHTLTTRANCTTVVCVGLPLMFRNALYNVIAVIQGGDVLGFVAKQHLAGTEFTMSPVGSRRGPQGIRRQ